jgi:hypothetical protein
MDFMPICLFQRADRKKPIASIRRRTLAKPPERLLTAKAFLLQHLVRKRGNAQQLGKTRQQIEGRENGF